MSAVIDKWVHTADFRAKRLERLAAAHGTTEDALIEEGLDLLFRAKDRQAAGEKAMQEGRELLQQLEAEIGHVPASTSAPLPMEEAILVVGTPIPPERIHHIEERR